MKQFIVVIWLAIALLTIGCGGGSGSSANSNTSASTVGQAQGVFSGTTSTGLSFETIILPNDKFYAVYGTTSGNLFLVEGMMTGQGTSDNGRYSGPITDYFFTGATSAGNISASYVAGSTINGTLTETGLTETFTGSAMSNTSFTYNTPAIQSNVTGTWAGTLLDGSTAIVNVNSSGTFSGSDSGCSFSGTMTPNSSGRNYFDVSLTFANSSLCLTPNQTQTGIAVDYLLANGVTRQIVAAVTGGSHGNVFIANR